MTIFWTRGDTPLPLNAGQMDLTDCTVVVRIRERDEPNGPITVLPATVLSGTKGELSVTSDAIPVGKYILEAEVRKGSFVATFPNGTDRQYLYVTEDLRGGTPLP